LHRFLSKIAVGIIVEGIRSRTMRYALIAILAMAAATVCHARTITVDDNSPADFTNIQTAINDANNGDTIIVRPGRYYGNNNRDIRFMSKAITVQSIDPNNPNMVSATTIVCGGSASQPYRGFIFDNNEGPNSVLAGLTITGGYGGEVILQTNPYARGYVGGGIFCKYSSPTITHCCITGNTAAGNNATGGGICYWGGRPTISQCIIINNKSNGGVGYTWPWPSFLPTGGGGIYGNGEGTVIDCIITENTASRGGGGISCFNSTVINCDITNNSADLGAGGVDCSNSRVLNCTIEENKVSNETYNALGGGIICDGNFIIDNCVIRKNSATGGGILHEGEKARDAKGGGIYAWTNNPSSVGTITNSIISENLTQGGTGGGIEGIGIGGPPPIGKILYGSGGDGMGGGIYCNDPCGEVKIANCLIVANKSKYGSCILSGHYPDGNAFGGGAYCGDVTLTACTFVANEAAKGAGIYGSLNVNSCILWDVNEQNSPPVSEVAGGAIVQYSNVKNGYAGVGNIETDPCFVEPGYWIEVNKPMPPFPPRITLIWVEGDYHLKSEGWSWDIERTRWAYDDVTSRCIDAGNPGSPLGDEPLSVPDDPDNEWGQNLRIDMGAYGGTAEASMPPYGWAILGDLTNDGTVDFNDFVYQAKDWQRRAGEQPGDLDRNGVVGMEDFGLLVEDWLLETSWHEN
jgi:hypothetical protein